MPAAAGGRVERSDEAVLGDRRRRRARAQVVEDEIRRADLPAVDLQREVGPLGDGRGAGCRGRRSLARRPEQAHRVDAGVRAGDRGLGREIDPAVLVGSERRSRGPRRERRDGDRDDARHDRELQHDELPGRETFCADAQPRVGHRLVRGGEEARARAVVRARPTVRPGRTDADETRRDHRRDGERTDPVPSTGHRPTSSTLRRSGCHPEDTRTSNGINGLRRAPPSFPYATLGPCPRRPPSTTTSRSRTGSRTSPRTSRCRSSRRVWRPS